MPASTSSYVTFKFHVCYVFKKVQDLIASLSDAPGLTESLFSAHKDDYPEHEQASLRQLYQAKVCSNAFQLCVYSMRSRCLICNYVLQMAELRTESQISDSSGTIGRSKGASVTSSHQQISVTVVTEFVRWNEEAITRCSLFSSQVILFHLLMLQITCYHWDLELFYSI